jgi:uncharacterized protein (DUF305 family)
VPLFSRGFVRRRAISLATSLSVMATSFALAQNPKEHSGAHPVTDRDERHFLFDIDHAMSNLNRSMPMTPVGVTDSDFVNMMVPHHQGTIDAPGAEPKHGRNDELRQLARKMASKQDQEIFSMHHALPAGVAIAAHAPN